MCEVAYCRDYPYDSAAEQADADGRRFAAPLIAKAFGGMEGVVESEDLCPSFEKAIERFRSFLRQQGWPDSLQWLNRSAVVLRSTGLVVAPSLFDGQKRVRAAYERGRQKMPGVLFAGVSHDSEHSCCYVWSPESELDAQYRLMQGGLKMNVELYPPTVLRASGIRFRWARFRGRSSEQLFA